MLRLNHTVWMPTEPRNPIRPITPLVFVCALDHPADMTSYASRSAYEFTESPQTTPVRPTKPATPAPVTPAEQTPTPSKTAAFSCTHFPFPFYSSSSNSSTSDTCVLRPFISLPIQQMGFFDRQSNRSCTACPGRSSRLCRL